LRERWEIWDRLALRTALVLAETPTTGAGRDDQMCAGSAGQPVRRSVSWPAAHPVRTARRWLICALCAARVRWSAARSWEQCLLGVSAWRGGTLLLCGIRTDNVARRAG
jgi:hypothetical protein